MNTPTRELFECLNLSNSYQQDLVDNSLVWSTSEIAGFMEGPDTPDYEHLAIQVPEAINRSWSESLNFGRPEIQNVDLALILRQAENRTGTDSLNLKDQDIPSIIENMSESMESAEPDGFLAFASQTQTDSVGKVNDWQESINPEKPEVAALSPDIISLPKRRTIRPPRRLAPGAQSPTVSSISEFSKETPSYVPSEATDSSFVPDGEDVSSDSSFDMAEEIPSPVSSVPKKSRRGRPSEKSKSNSCGNRSTQKPPTARRTIKSEPGLAPKKSRGTKFIKVVQEYESDDCCDCSECNYGWEYSESNDLAPVELIVDQFICLPYENDFDLLRFLQRDEIQ